MQHFPTVKQVIQALPSNLDFDYAPGGGESSYSFPRITGGNLAPVQQTLVLCDENMRYYVCAVLEEHSWEPRYNQAGCKNQAIAGWDVTLVRRSSDLGRKLIELEFGQRIALFGLKLVTVNIGGGPVPGCKSFAELACLVEYQLFKQHLEKRKRRLRTDIYSFKKFAELKSYTEELNREIETQQYFDGIQFSSLYCLEEVLDLEDKLLIATEREMCVLHNFRNEAIRLEEEAKEIARFPSRAHYEAHRRRKRQKQDKERQLQEDEKRKEQARLQAEQEKRAQRKQQQEQFLLEQRRQIQARQKHRLKLQCQERQKYQQELLQAQCTTLPTLGELMRRLRSLTNFYPPHQGNYDAFVHQVELLSVGCRRGLSNASRQGNTKGWDEVSNATQKLKTKCLKLAQDSNWLRPEEDEAWKDL